MLLSFLPIKDEQGRKVMPHALDMADTVRSSVGVTASKIWMSTYVPMVFANAPNLAPKAQGMCVDCKGMYKMEIEELNLVLLYIELADRFGYMCLYNSSTTQLLYMCYCGEITLTLAVKNMFANGPSGHGPLKNICMVAPIDAVITSEEPYRSEWISFNTSFMLSSHSYVYLNGSILKCKRIGRQGRDLQVVDKFYITNKIPELNKALSHDPTCLLNANQILSSLSSNKDTAQKLVDRLSGKTLPLAKMTVATALSDTENDADLIVSLAKVPQNDTICATLSNDWLKRAVKHKLNKFPPEFTSDGKYEVQQLTTEATIKYQGDTWKGAEKSDLIYVIVEKVSRKPVSIVSIGKQELETIKLRRYNLKSVLGSHKKVVEHIYIDFDNFGLDRILMTGFIDDHEGNTNKDGMRAYVTEYPSNTVAWRDFFNHEAVIASDTADDCKTFTGEILEQRKTNRFDNEYAERELYMYKNTEPTFGRITTTNSDCTKHICTIKREYEEAQPRSFNFATITITMPDKNGVRQTFEGKVKFGVALMKNVNDRNDNFMLYAEKCHHYGIGNSRYRCFSLCDFIFPNFVLHESSVYDTDAEKGYQLVVSNAIYGKKFKDTAKFLLQHKSRNIGRALAEVAKLVSTGINYEPNPLTNALSLGYLPDTYEEYCELAKLETLYSDIEDRSKTAMYTASSLSYDDESLLDAMEDDDYSDLLDEDTADDEEYLDDGFDDAEYDEPDSEEDEELLDQMDDTFQEEEMAEEEWQTQRLLWMQRHPDSIYITNNGEKVYWFDIMHNMMKTDQPGSANNIQLMETIWNSMLSKMEGYNAHDVMAMMYEQLKATSQDDDTSTTDTSGTAGASLTTADDTSGLTDDDDDLFADL